MLNFLGKMLVEKSMSKVIAVSNHKGGVGKTTSTLNIGSALSNKGFKVLLVDFDPQANLSQSLHKESEPISVYDYIKEDRMVSPVKINENLYLIPSSLDLSAAEIEISAEPGREYILGDVLEKVKADYDDANKSIEVILDACCDAIAEGIEERKAERVDAEAAAEEKTEEADSARVEDEEEEAPAEE